MGQLPSEGREMRLWRSLKRTHLPFDRRSPVRADSPWGVGIHYPISMTKKSSYGIDTRSVVGCVFNGGAAQRYVIVAGIRDIG